MSLKNFLVAKKAKTIHDLNASLVDFGFPSSSTTMSFATELFESFSKNYVKPKVCIFASFKYAKFILDRQNGTKTDSTACGTSI